MFCVGCHVFSPWFSVTSGYINGVMFCLQYRLQISCRFLSTSNFFKLEKRFVFSWWGNLYSTFAWRKRQKLIQCNSSFALNRTEFQASSSRALGEPSLFPLVLPIPSALNNSGQVYYVWNSRPLQLAPVMLQDFLQDFLLLLDFLGSFRVFFSGFYYGIP